MLLEIFSENLSDQLKSDIIRIDALLLSDQFLLGVSASSGECQIPDDIEVVRDVIKAHEMMVSQEIWNLPEPWPYQYFVGEVEAEASKFAYSSGLSSAQKRHLLKPYNDNHDQLSEKLLNHLAEVYRQKKIVNFLSIRKELERKSDDEIIFIIENSFQNEICAYLIYMIKVCFLTGLNNSSLYSRMLQIFEWGGIPCGWLGGVSHSDGADPLKCMTMLHFGPIADKT